MVPTLGEPVAVESTSPGRWRSSCDGDACGATGFDLAVRAPAGFPAVDVEFRVAFEYRTEGEVIAEPGASYALEGEPPFVPIPGDGAPLAASERFRSWEGNWTARSLPGEGRKYVFHFGTSIGPLGDRAALIGRGMRLEASVTPAVEPIPLHFQREFPLPWGIECPGPCRESFSTEFQTRRTDVVVDATIELDFEYRTETRSRGFYLEASLVGGEGRPMALDPPRVPLTPETYAFLAFQRWKVEGLPAGGSTYRLELILGAEEGTPAAEAGTLEGIRRGFKVVIDLRPRAA